MRTREIVPTLFVATEDHEPDYSGHVVMKVMNFNERDIFQERMRAKFYSQKEELAKLAELVKEGDVDKQVEAVAQGGSGMAMIRALADELPSFLVSVDITRLEDGEKITSYEDMSYEPGLHAVIYELAGAVMGNPKGAKRKASVMASEKQPCEPSAEQPDSTN